MIKERAIRHYYHHIERQVSALLWLIHLCADFVWNSIKISRFVKVTMKQTLRMCWYVVLNSFATPNNYEITPSNLQTECKENKDVYREEMHARGGCCHGKPTPLPIEFLRRPPTEAIRECASAIVDSILPNKTYYLGLEFQDSDAQQLVSFWTPSFVIFRTALNHGKCTRQCQTACTLNMLGLTDETIDNQMTFSKPLREWTPKQVEDGMEIYNFDPAHVFDILTRVFSQEWRKSLNIQFLPAWNFTREVEESVMPLATRLWETGMMPLLRLHF